MEGIASGSSRKRSYTNDSLESSVKSESLFEGKKNPSTSTVSNRLKETISAPVRKGKWTLEEETYANKIIYYFNQGQLNIPPGSTLRCYLSEKLNCDPMRITKKFAGASCIGKQVFLPCDVSNQSADAIRSAEEDLARLEKLFSDRLVSKGLSLLPAGKGSVYYDDDTNFDSRKRMRRVDKGLSRRFSSAPDLSALSSLSRSSELWNTSAAGGMTDDVPLQSRCRSEINLDHYSADDQAAGDLLLQCFRQMSQQSPYDANNINEEEHVTEFPFSSTDPTMSSPPSF